MADTFQTVADVAVFNDGDLNIQVNDVLDDAPFLRALAARSIPGITYQYIRKTAAPNVGFRNENDGRENDKATYENVTVGASILDASFAVDQAVAEADERGWQAHLGMHAVDHLRAAFAHAETQLIYGTDANGFEGLAEMSNLDGLSDAQVIDAGGTGSNCSSVWLIRSGLLDVHSVWGQTGEISLGDVSIQRLSGTTGTYPAYYMPISAWMGLQVGSTYSVIRIANINPTNPLTDALMSQALAEFPAGRGPSFAVMSRRSRQQLQDSRTATNATGAPAPFPESAFGVPIIATDQQLNTETALA